MSNPIQILQVGPLPDYAVPILRGHFELLRPDDFARPSETPEFAAQRIRGIATTGKAVIGEALLDRLPKLEIISCLGAGADGIDTTAAANRGIAIATTSSVLAADVADVAAGLILSLARDFRGAGRFVRDGRWADGRYPLGHALGGANLGIIGLGNIGAALARRADAFGMTVGYHTRSPRAGSPYRYFSDLTEMARWSRFLAVCCPGGAETLHLVGPDILRELGPEGYLINVARGSIVDESALAAMLEQGSLAGAGLDVFEDEPNPHPALLNSPRTLLLPHIGSATHETRQAMATSMVEALVSALISRRA